MTQDSSYNYTSPKGFVIENGIIKGGEEPLPTNYKNYGEFILERMRKYPNFIGQVDGYTGRTETLGEMTAKSIKCALWFKEQNIKPGDIIGICTHNQMDMYVPCFASLYEGAVFNPWWDGGLTKEMTRHFITLTEPKVLFVNKVSAPMAAEVAKEVGIDVKIIVFGKLPGFQSLDEILATQDDKLVAGFTCKQLPSLDEPAFFLYTSGSTGLPKGVLHSHKAIMGNLGVNGTPNTNSTVTTMLFSPLAWSTGVNLMFHGATLLQRRVIYPEFNEETTLQLVEKFKVNWMLLGTSMAYRLHKCPNISNYDLSSLQTIVVTGAVLKEETQKEMAVKFPGTTVSQIYGSTEIGTGVIEMKIGAKYGSCGTIIKNYSMKIIDTETGRILGPNQTGEACFKSSYMMTCYYKNPKATREVIDDEGWFHTGDLARYDEEGFVYVTDRIKEMIKYRGNHVSPAMIEKVLLTHPKVAECAVLGIPHPTDDEHAIAFVVLTPMAKVTQAELEKLVADVLPDYMKLRGGVEFMDELPHTANGKIARSELRKLARSYAR